MSATAAAAPPARLDPLERLEALCDPGSIRVLRSRARSSRLGDRAVERRRRGRRDRHRSPAARSPATPRTARSSAARSESATPTRSCACWRLAGRARMPVVGFVESGGARMQEGTAALAGYGRIFRHTVALTGVVPQISIVSGASAGGGAYSPALTDLIVMTQDAAMFLTGPGRRARGAGRGDRRCRARRPARARPQRRLPSGRARRGRAPRPACASCWATCPRRPASRRRAPRRWSPCTPTRARSCRPRSRSAYDVRDALGGDRRPRLAAGALPSLGPQPGHRAGPDRRAPGRDRRQPAALPRRRARRRGLGEGGPVRRLLQLVRAAADRRRRHAGLHARLQAGAGRRDPSRRLAGARVCGRHACRSSPSCCASPTAAPTSR